MERQHGETTSMNTLMQIITLQNATFNQWTWIIGTVISLILIGMKWETYAHDEQEVPITLSILAFFWPICLLMVLLVGIVYCPIWIGRQLAKFNKENL
jgi:predicted membrane channel-forming protein YqfA (hemolysin III family)